MSITNTSTITSWFSLAHGNNWVTIKHDEQVSFWVVKHCLLASLLFTKAFEANSSDE
jgi:hypothetical protein